MQTCIKVKDHVDMEAYSILPASHPRICAQTLKRFWCRWSYENLIMPLVSSPEKLEPNQHHCFAERLVYSQKKRGLSHFTRESAYASGVCCPCFFLSHTNTCLRECTNSIICMYTITIGSMYCNTIIIISHTSDHGIQ